MHQNYFFLRQLSKELQQRLVGLEIATCFTQNRDELVLGLCSPTEEFWIKAVLHAQVNALSFPNELQRAKQNTVDLFRPIVGQIVQEVRQFANERAFGLVLGNGLTLVFKLFGNRSNVVLFEGEQAVALFRNQQAHDAELALSALDRNIDVAQFHEIGLKAIPTLGKDALQWLQERGWASMNQSQQWALLQQLLAYLEHPNYYVKETADGLPQLSLFEGGQQQPTAIEACNAFFYGYARIFYLEQAKNDALKLLHRKAKSTWNYIEKTSGKLHELKHASRYEEIGHLLMANLHAVPPRAEKVVLHDFYKDADIEIKLNPTLSAQKNAENYYRKAKNQKLEIAQLEENLQKKEEAVLALEEQIAHLQAQNSLKDLRKYMKANGLDAEESQQPAFPFKRFLYQGFEIWVGKNAKNNDLLTQKYAFKEDLWLHARDVSGSHVLVKYQAGKRFPQEVIEKAASLAAYYSQRKNDTLCPVICTPKKFVRKPKGLDAGAVIVDKEEVVMVQPAPFE